ncbi:MAG: hypothetical protein SGARI_002657 [Bacillariaceae sp.]
MKAKKESAPSIQIKLDRKYKDRGIFQKEGVLNLVRFVHESNYMDFQEAMSDCDVLTPLIDPEHNPEYFPKAPNTLKRLSGSLPQAIAYKIPLLMHIDLYPVYKDYLTAPCLTYADSPSFGLALQEMIATL